MYGVKQIKELLILILNYFQLVSYAMPYLEQLGEMLEREERGTVYNYLMWRVVMELMPYLPLRSSVSKIERRERHQSIRSSNSRN
jgi:hypothetical protein